MSAERSAATATAVVRADAPRAQQPCQAIGPRVQLAVGQGRRAGAHGNGIGRCGDLLFDQFMEDGVARVHASTNRSTRRESAAAPASLRSRQIRQRQVRIGDRASSSVCQCPIRPNDRLPVEQVRAVFERADQPCRVSSMVSVRSKSRGRTWRIEQRDVEIAEPQARRDAPAAARNTPGTSGLWLAMRSGCTASTMRSKGTS